MNVVSGNPNSNSTPPTNPTTGGDPDATVLDSVTYFIPAPPAPAPPAPPPPPPSGAPGPAKPPVSAAWRPTPDDFVGFFQKRTAPPPADFKKQRDTKFDGVDNSTHEWLVYETVFNHDQFQRTPDRRPIGAYSIPVNKLTILLSSSVSDAAAQDFCNAFFPGFSAAELKALAFRPGVAWNQAEFTKFAAAKLAHLPYNQLANDMTAVALGTFAKPTPKDSAIVTRLQGEWPIWQTASRSCVIRLTPSGNWAADTRAVEEGKPLHWPFRDDRDAAGQPADVPSPKLTIAQLDKSYSIKTGVVWVGAVNQASRDSGDKAKLEPESLIAHLRSEYFNALDAWVSARPDKKAKLLVSQLIVLPEVLTVTYREDVTKDPTGGGDGFQLRDLSRLDRACKYFPPLSISYTGVRQIATPQPTAPQLALKDKVYLDKYQDRFSATKELFAFGSSKDVNGDIVVPPIPDTAQKSIEWYGYWSVNFAGRIGRAKALLHICYGVQALTPNAQNFLLEYKPDNTSTRRVAVRDLLDMRLHSDWISTIFSPNPKLTSSITDLKDAFAKSAVPSDALKRILAYEASMPGDKFETFADKIHEATKRVQYYKGTQLNWFPYTSLIRGSQVALQSDLSSGGDSRFDKWQNALYANTTWALTHALEYAKVLKEALGIDIRQTDIENIPLSFGDSLARDKVIGTKFRSAVTMLSRIATYSDVVVKSKAEDKDDDDAKKLFHFRANALEIVDLPNTKAGYDRAGELYNFFEQWERRVSYIIHEKLYSPEGRAKLRQFHGLA